MCFKPRGAETFHGGENRCPSSTTFGASVSQVHYDSMTNQLVYTHVGGTCLFIACVYRCEIPGCNKGVTVTHRFEGACLVIQKKCKVMHIMEWMSSPGHRNALGYSVPVINILFASSLLHSGNNFTKIELMTKFLGLRMISRSSFTVYQRLYLCPGIEKFWAQSEVEIMNNLQAKTSPLILSGRNIERLIIILRMNLLYGCMNFIIQVMAGTTLPVHQPNTVYTR